MSQQLIPFTFESHDVRTLVHDDGTPWWVLADVCKVLGLSNPSEVIKRLGVDALRKTEVIDTLGRMQSLHIVNEPGLYQVIFRSNKEEARRFQKWVFEEVLPSIRKTGAYAIPTAPAPQPALPSPAEQLDIAERAVRLLEHLGGLTERDKLMYQDYVRNATLPDQKRLAAGSTPYGFSVAERVATLGYRLNRKEQSVYYPILGKRLAAEYRSRHGIEPGKETRYVDGANRPVVWYPQDCTEWVDAIIQGYMASLDMFVR